VKSDVIGAYDRSTGILVIDTYAKLAKGEESLRRFGPPSIDDITPYGETWIKPGSHLHTDGAKAYHSVAKPLGIFHAYVDHQSGEYSRHERFKGKLREISTQRIDGQWGNLRTMPDMGLVRTTIGL